MLNKRLMMKTFTASDLTNDSCKIFKTAAEEGAVIITHSRYRNTDFILSAKKGKKENLHRFMAKYAKIKG